MEPISEKNPGRALGSRTGQAVDEFIGDVRERARGIKDEYIDPGWNKTRDFVRDNPGKTILLAAGVGMLLGALIGRRRY